MFTNTRYQYVFCGKGKNNRTVSGGIKYFTTKKPPASDVKTLDAFFIEENSAWIEFEHRSGYNAELYVILSKTSSRAHCFTYNQNDHIDYGIGSGSSGLTYSGIVTGLDANTTYYYRACAKDLDGYIDVGQIKSFTTLPPLIACQPTGQMLGTSSFHSRRLDLGTYDGEVDVFFRPQNSPGRLLIRPVGTNLTYGTNGYINYDYRNGFYKPRNVRYWDIYVYLSSTNSNRSWFLTVGCPK